MTSNGNPLWPEVSDPRDRKVLEALDNPYWDFRTVGGIAKDTGLSESEVRQVLEKYPDYVRRSPLPDSRGHGLYALRSKPVKLQELLSEARTFISKTIY